MPDIDPVTLVVRNGLVLSEVDPAIEPRVQDVVVRDGVIVEVGPEAGRQVMAGADTVVVDATDQLVVPGFVNAHYHSHDVLAKGAMEEEFLEAWALRALPPSFPPRTREEVKVRTMLGALECLRAGITAVQDMVTLFPFDPDHLDAVVEAYTEIGIRAVVGPQYADKSGLQTRQFWEEVFPQELHHLLTSFAEPDPDFDLLAHLDERFGASDPEGRVSWALAPTAPESCTDDLIRRTVALAEAHDLPIFTHIYESKSMALEARVDYAEHGGSLITWLEGLGMLGPRVNLAHSVWLLPEEIETLARTGTKVVLNLLSNLKLKSGVPPIHELQEAGISYALGCDNPSCSDSQNMFQAMKLTATLNGISHPDPLSRQAEQVFAAATRGGARAVLKEQQLGGLAVGQRADLFTVDLHDPSWLPLNNAVRQLVYSESGRGVRTVVVDGDVVVRDGRSTKVDEADLRDRLAAVMPTFRRDFAAITERVEMLRPYLLEAHHRVWAEDVGMNRQFTGV